MSNPVWPRQDIPETKKNKKWFKEHLDYAEMLLKNSDQLNTKMARLYDSYNGKSEAESIRYLVSTYGKANRSKYIPYRLSKTKLDILIGEFLKTPLNATVKTINSEAINAKMSKYELMLGAMNAKAEIEKLRSVGVDVLEGMPIPDKNDPSAFSKLSFKDKNEAVMQIMLKEFVKELGLHGKLSNNVQDCTITSRCYGKTSINKLTGDMDYQPIDPRNRICMEFERDPFMERSPLMGAVDRVPIDKILTTYKLTNDQRKELDTIRQNPQNYISDSQYRNRYSYRNGNFCADVIHMEWRSVRPKYTKITPKTENQMNFGDSTETYSTTMQPREYEDNQEKYDTMVAGKKMDIITEWEEDMYEATRIGHAIDVDCGRKSFIMKDEDTGKILGFSYTGLIFNQVDGETISLKEVCENFDNVFDVTMYQLLKEINKAKGKVIVYDRAGLPKKTTVKNVLYNALNDSFIDYDSSAAGNMSGKDLTINNIFKEIDLGVSNSFQYLLQMKNEVVNMLDMITGIHGAREGKIAASATVANSQQSDEASRTITEPMFYYLTKYAEKVMMNILETGKLVWGIYQPNKARMILGDEKYQFLQVTQDIAFACYSPELVNPRWEQQIRERMRKYAEFSLNAKELRIQDALDFELAETLADAKAGLRKAWKEISDDRAKVAQQQMMVDSENAEKAQQTQIELMREDREDKQQAEIDKIVAKAKADITVLVAKQKGELLLANNEMDNNVENSI